MKFLFSGGMAAGVEYGVFLGLHFLLGPSLFFISQSVSFLCGFVVSFLLNKKWVFSNTQDTRPQLIRYAILAAINLILSNIALWLLADVLGVYYFIAKLLIMAIIATWNYVLFSRLIFVSKVDR